MKPQKPRKYTSKWYYLSLGLINKKIHQIKQKTNTNNHPRACKKKNYLSLVKCIYIFARRMLALTNTKSQPSTHTHELKWTHHTSSLDLYTYPQRRYVLRRYVYIWSNGNVNPLPRWLFFRGGGPFSPNKDLKRDIKCTISLAVISVYITFSLSIVSRNITEAIQTE